jgi:uncharacterized protein
MKTLKQADFMLLCSHGVLMKKQFTSTLLAIIRFYQKTLSPDYGWFSVYFPYGYCRFHPTCSEYAHRAITKHGVLRGVLKGMWRIIRCNPLSRGGIDTV